MFLIYSWLKEYVDIDVPPEVLSERLTMAGVEVESISSTAPEVKGVVTAEIVSIKSHPQADRLVLCEVRTDEGIKNIVCGAKNMKEGDKVALALPGARLPGGIKIKRSKIRGEVSEGMLCSEVELGVADTSEGIMILPPDTPLGIDINEVTGGADTVMDVAVTPNRADLLSIRGLAREVAALFGARFRKKSLSPDEKGAPVKDLVNVSVEAGGLCPRYALRVVSGVTIGPSPEKVRRRLEASGIRPINNVVDATNYVMLEIGQPLHAFDLDKIGDRRIIVRRARKGETIETLDGVSRTLDEGMLVIADPKGPVAVAGVMGGANTEVDENTKNIVLESALFDPASVRRTSKTLNLGSESSYRFERGVDPEGVKDALDMVAAMIAENAGGSVAKGSLDIYPERIEPPEVALPLDKAERMLGMEVRSSEARAVFKRLNIGVKSSGKKGLLICRPPSYRQDLKEDVDLIEEFIRLKGYDTVPCTMPAQRLAPAPVKKNFEVRKRVQDLLVNMGFLEAVNYSFISSESFSLTGPPDRPAVLLKNPLTEDQTVMRDSLLPSLVETLRRNLARKNEHVKVFEYAPAFLQGEEGPSERWKAAGLLYGLRWRESWNYPKEMCDFFDCKGAVERILDGLGLSGVFSPGTRYSRFFHPGRSATLHMESKEAGVLGELHPDIRNMYKIRHPAYLFELDMGIIVDIFGEYKRYRAISRYPESTRDIAFVVDEGVSYQEIIDSLKSLDTKLIENVELFDVYCGGAIPEGRRSMALRITYRRSDRTLTHKEVEKAHKRVAALLTERFGAEIRGEDKS